jgi:S1-C subfamily serine protease
VVTPRLGFFTQDLDARLAAALKLGAKKGVLVSDVIPGQSADKAGLKRGDLIVSVNGRSISNSAEFRTRLFEVSPGELMRLGIMRKGQTLEVDVATLPAASENRGWHGIEAEPNSVEKAKDMGLAITRGMIIHSVAKGSSAEKIGLSPGDIIVEVNQQRVDSSAQWKKANSSNDEREDAIILIVRGRQSAYIVLPGEE